MPSRRSVKDQEIIFHTAGKRVHGTGSVPGGVNKSLAVEERDLLLKDIYQMIAWSREAVHIIRGLFENNLAEYNAFGRFRSHSMSLVRADADAADGRGAGQVPRSDSHAGVAGKSDNWLPARRVYHWAFSR